MDLTLAVVTDLHFGPEARFEGKLRKLSAHAGTLVAAFVERMNREVRPDLVFDLGDDIEDESPDADRARYAACARLLAGCQAEVRHVAGNHDTVHLTHDDLRAAWGHEGALHYAFDRGGAHLVVLHTHETKDVDVRIDAPQLEWLERDLAATALPTLVFMHHPASDQDLAGNRWFSRAPHLARVAERKRLRRILAASGKVVGVFNGHLHWNHLDVCDGIPYVTVQSLVENLDDDAPGRPAAAHAVVRLTDRRLLVDIAGAEPARYQFER